MALRNAFEAMSTESTQRKVLHAVSLARDNVQRLRIIVENQITITALSANSGDGNVRRQWNDPWAHFMTDEREHLKAQLSANAIARRQKWTY